MPNAAKLHGPLAQAEKLDAGPFSLVQSFDLEDRYEYLGSMGISVKGPVLSILFYSRVPMEELSGALVGATRESATAVQLMKVILEHRSGVRPREYTALDSPGLDAFLLIGDDALLTHGQVKGYPYRYDLAEEWLDWKGLPFVFAVWMARRSLDDGVKVLLADGLRENLARNMRDNLKSHSRQAGVHGYDVRRGDRLLAGTSIHPGQGRHGGHRRVQAGVALPSRSKGGNCMSESTQMKDVAEKVRSGERLNQEEGLYLLEEAPLLELGALAQEVRFRHNPKQVVTFVVDTNLNYTNVCDAYCTFCAFYRTEKDDDAYTHSVEQVMEMVGQAASKGVTTVLLQGGLNPKLPMEYYEELVRETRARYPQVLPHFFSAPEIQKMSQVSETPISEVLRRLKDAGQETLPGGGSEVLSDSVRHRLSRLWPKATVQDWVDVHREAHKLGYRTTATMMYGHVEKPQDLIEHLEHTRSVQDESLSGGYPGFTAFIPWSYKRENTALSALVKTESGPNPYLRMIALSRIYLDNVQHIQASWFSERKKTGEVALNFGADDFGGTLFDENVMQEAGFYNRTTADEIKSIIRDAGFTPAQRTTKYEILQVFDGE